MNLFFTIIVKKKNYEKKCGDEIQCIFFCGNDYLLRTKKNHIILQAEIEYINSLTLTFHINLLLLLLFIFKPTISTRAQN